MKEGEADPLMVSISGIRGLAGSSLTPAVVERYVSAFCHLLRTQDPPPPPPKRPAARGPAPGGARPRIVLGSDSRVSGPWIVRLAQAIFLANGFDVLDVGVVPTPTVQFLVNPSATTAVEDGAATPRAGLIVTASHNPEPWNGLKFVDGDGLFLAPERCAALFQWANLPPPFARVPFDGAGLLALLPVDAPDAAHVRHADAILRLPQIDPAAVARLELTVALDAINGAGGRAMAHLLAAFGVRVVGINLEPSGRFAHMPEPVPEHLGQLGAAVREHGADFGIAVDPDVDRCVLLDERGVPVGEEYTLALAAKFWLGPCAVRGPVCKNLSSSRALDDIARKYGCPVLCAPVGEIHVARKMVECGAVIGGEGNGGVMLPDVHIGRDALVAAALVLQYYARYRAKDPAARSMRTLVEKLPRWYIVKLKAVRSPAADAALDRLRDAWVADPSMSVDLQDGIRVDAPDYWLHLRKSNTEPIIRVICESSTPEAAREVAERHIAMLQ